MNEMSPWTPKQTRRIISDGSTCILSRTHTKLAGRPEVKGRCTLMFFACWARLSGPFFESSGQVRWPVYPPAADGILPCAWVLAMPCPFLGLAVSGKIPTFINATGPAAKDTRSMSSPYAQVPVFTICPTVPSLQHTHTHTNLYGHTYWHERHILTSSCSTLDQQKGSHMQSVRGLWGQGAWFGKQPYYETCRSKTRQTGSLQTLGLTVFFFPLFLFIYEQTVYLHVSGELK